jgi:CRP-like cAMP-binding protein
VTVFPSVETLGEQPFLAGLTERQLSLLVPTAGQSMFHAGNRIFLQATPAEQFWLITDGTVYLDSEVPGHTNIVLDRLTAGDVLGWSWLYPPYRWHFGAVAITTTHAFAFNGSLVRALLQRDPHLGYDLAMRFLRVMGDRLQSARRRLEDYERAAPRHHDL